MTESIGPARDAARPGIVATLGVFDGVHLGHEYLIRTTLDAAREAGARARILTFDPHPAMVLAPGRLLNLLTPLEEKLRRLHDLGALEVRVVRFDRELSRLEPEEFISQVVAADGGLSHLVIGHDFALGRERSGDASRLTRIGETAGFRVTRVPALRLEGDVVSSSRIREALRAGDLPRVTRLLGRPYGLGGTVVPGDARGRQIGFPTANLKLPPDKTPPPFGVYAVRVSSSGVVGLGARHPGVMNFGRRPTFGENHPVAEIHLLDFSGELVGQDLEVELWARLREEMRFPGIDALSAQIRSDIEIARGILGSPEGFGSPPRGRG